MNSFISWIGGKKSLWQEIYQYFPKSIDTYVEVFGGAGWLLFYKDRHAKKEVYNDINSNLVNLFKCVKYHPEAITKELEYILNSREIFHQYRDLYENSNLTEIQRASIYFYLIRASFGSSTKSFGLKFRDVTNTDYLIDAQKRLKNVLIENKSYNNLIEHFDKENTLFYCDPPYYKAEKHYDTGDFLFDMEEHIKLNNVLRNIKGNFILSYNNVDFIKNLYKDFDIVEVSRQNNLSNASGKKNSKYKEIIIKNY